MVAAVPYPDMAIQLALQARPNSSDNPAWTDITELVTGASAITNGHPYSVPQGQASTPTVTIRDVLELFNPANSSSPFVNGAGGRNILPYRGIVWQAMHPRGGTGNILNAGTWESPTDPSFESYPANVGYHPAWVTDFGVTSSVTSTTPPEGANCLSWSAGVSATFQGIEIPFQCIPGRYYIVSALVRQSAANTMQLGLSGHTAVATSTAVNTAVRLSGVVWADQPQLVLLIGTTGASLASTFIADAIQIEPTAPLNSPDNWNKPGQLNGYAGSNATLSQTNADAGFNLGSLSIVPTASTHAATGPEIPVTAGTPYAVAIGARTPTPNLNRTFSINWYDSSHVLISSTSDPITLNSSDYRTRDPLAYTSPAGAAFARLSAQGTTTGTWRLDHLDLIPATPSAFTTAGPVVYPVLRDYVERWPRRYATGSNGFEGYADLRLVDGMAALAAIKLHTEYVAMVLSKAPSYFWRLNDRGTTFAETSGSGGPPLTALDGIYGPGPTFSAGSPTNIAGDPGGTGLSSNTGTVTMFVPATVAQAGFNGYPLVTIGGSNPCGWTVVFWMSHTPLDPAGTSFQEAMSLSQRGADLFNLLINQGTPSTLQVFAAWPGPSGIISAGVTVNDTWADGNMHLFVGTVSVSGGTGTLTLYVDGTQVGTSTISASGSFTNYFSTYAQIGGYLTQGGSPIGALPGGVYSDLAMWNRALSAGDVTDLWNAGRGYPGELPGARLARRLATGGFLAGTPSTPASRISSGRSILGPSSRPDRTPALDDAQRLVLEEMGTLWIRPDGALAFESRDDRFTRTTSAMVFGEDIANGECPYTEGVTYDFDPLYVYGDVQLTQTDGTIATGGLAADIANTNANYFGRSYPAPDALDLQDPAMVQDMANWIFYIHKDPAQRIESITIDPMSNPALWPYVLKAMIGRRITVKRRPQGLTGGVVYSSDYFIEQINHDQINFDNSDAQPWSWKTTLSLTPAPISAQPWLLDDPTYSVLDSTTRLGV